MMTDLFRISALAAAATLCTALPALAQSVQAEALVQGLQARPQLTRSLSAEPAPPQMDDESRRFLRALPMTRSLVEEDRTALAEITQTYALPSIDVSIAFDYDVASPRADSVPDIVQIGLALTSPQLAGQRFVLAGHTDAAGSASYNQDLSQRRAEAVRDFLIRSFSIPPERLIAVGFGFEQLEDIANPLAAANRRVEIINIEGAWD